MPDFLTLRDVLFLHNDQVDLYGGGRGVRDLGLLESAIAQPQASHGGEYLNADLFEMAALVFLALNGIEVDAPKGSLYELTMSVVQDRADKGEVADFFRGHAH